MGRKGRAAPAEFVTRLVERGAELAAKQLDIPDAQIRVLMRDLAHAVCQDYGGQRFYFPKDREYELDRRDESIWAAYTGNNTADLACDYNLTPQQVLNICRRMREQVRARRLDAR